MKRAVSLLMMCMLASGCATNQAKLLYLTATVPQEGSSVVVSRVAPDSIAQKAGLKIRDEITRVNQEKITGWNQFYTLLNEAGDRAILSITRENEKMTIPVEYELNKAAELGMEVIPVDGLIPLKNEGALHYQYKDGIQVVAQAITDDKQKASLVIILLINNLRDNEIEIKPDALQLIDGYRSIMTPQDIRSMASGIGQSADQSVSNFLAYSQLSKQPPSYQISGTAYSYGNFSSFQGSAQPNGIRAGGAALGQAIGYAAAKKRAEGAKQAVAMMLEEAFRAGPIPSGVNRVGKIYYPQPKSYPVYVSVKVEGIKYDFEFISPRTDK